MTNVSMALLRVDYSELSSATEITRPHSILCTVKRYYNICISYHKGIVARRFRWNNNVQWCVASEVTGPTLV